ncbi:hypothetical protein ELY21_00440 [Legionella sp. km535]|uniref:hypothetical protein n=1 Tax=Legionella sp. km535 TaxID=2498107 RepID=UPI000F8E7B33|nr:hypothetical protein [Legionella sp. km535]RUR20589.1 hypothetical protein ELY21_00440 [Legionella sp. km535]
MLVTKFSKHINGLIEYLSSPDERGNADLIRNYFREMYPQFKCETQANDADGYVPGHFILELKSKQQDWFKGLIQGLAYKRHLDVTLIVVATHNLLAVWDVKDIPDQIVDEIYLSQDAASKIGVQLAKKYETQARTIFNKALWRGEGLTGIFSLDTDQVLREIKLFEKTLKDSRKTRLKITTDDFTKILKEMVDYFINPIKAVSAFYSMIFGWTKESVVEFSKKSPEMASLRGEVINNLNPRKSAKFKEFVEKYYIHLRKDENIDDFFAKYDRALDSVDRDFRIKHGIFFTDLSLSKFVLWYVKQSISNLGEDYLVIDPACGSGNLVTNWRAPLQLRHKIVSEIEPELLFTVENRMKGDAWHYGKYTVIPRISEGKGLNFLTHSAVEYLDILKSYLPGKDVNKPIAFLCNPPYRGDDDQSASSVEYQIHPDILLLIGKEAATERYNCFLAQMKLICDQAPDSGLPEDSLLLVFTKSSWLTDRLSFEKIQNIITESFDFQGGLLFNSKEFFDVKGKFPIAFTIWKYRNKIKQSNAVKRNVLLCDLTWVEKKKLQEMPWPINEKNDSTILDDLCKSIINDKRSIFVSLTSKHLKSIREWAGQKMLDFKRDRRVAEIGQMNVGGLPENDHRMANKKAYGDANGKFIGFMDDLTPCRVKRGRLDFLGLD